MNYIGSLGEYGAGGYYFDFPHDINIAKALVKDLKENAWLTHGTRAIFVDFAIYNVNLNMVCVIKYEHY